MSKESTSKELSQAIKAEIVKLSRWDKENELLHYIATQIRAGKIKPEHFLYYAIQNPNIKSQVKPFGITANIINRIGVVVSELPDPQQNKLWLKFYMLAADRDDDLGCVNYASLVIHDDIATALKYAKKAVDLTQKLHEGKDKHKWVLGWCLLKSENFGEAFTMYAEYFSYQIKRYYWSSTLATKQEVVSEFQPKIIILIDALRSFVLQAQNYPAGENRARFMLATLEPFFGLNGLAGVCEDAATLMARIFYMKGLCHDALDEYPQAMQAFCHTAIDKKHSFYREVIQKRARLLKDQVTRDLTPAAPANLPSVRKSSSIKKSQQEESGGIDKFSSFWVQDSKWVNSAEASRVSDEFDKCSKQMSDVIDKKQKDLSQVNILLKQGDQDGGIAKKKKELLDEITELENEQDILFQSERKYDPERRRVVRRHVTEQSFFNPARSKKRAELIALTHQLIDQRYKLPPLQVNDAVPPPVILDGTNARRLITAERVFQNAVVILTGKGNPILGIPRDSENKWEIIDYYTAEIKEGANGLGPKERYQIDHTEACVRHRTSPKLNRLGDSFLLQHGKYTGDIYRFLYKLANENQEKEKKLASFMIRYGSQHKGISLNELQVIYAGATLDDVHSFNQICFLIIEKEQAQWHLAVEERYQLGMAVAQARCLIMVSGGFLSFKDVFRNNTSYGVYSQEGIIKNPEKVESACKEVEKLYMQYLQYQHLMDEDDFLDDALKTKVLTRHQAHRDLREVYGGESDTDDNEDGYDSDLSFSM